MRRGSKLLFVAVAAVFSTGLVQASTSFVQDEASHEWTSVSGYSGSTKVIFAKDRQLGLHALSFREKADDPIEISAFQASLLSGRAQGAGEAGTVMLRGGSSQSTAFVPLGEGNFITAVQVCTNNAKDSLDAKIKGARIWGASLLSDGKLQANVTPAKFERTNCSAWKSKVNCASGKVATGLRAHYASEARGFAGLSLRCTTPKKP